MSAVRPPAVAGSFYPADAGRLRAAVEGYLAAANGAHAAAIAQGGDRAARRLRLLGAGRRPRIRRARATRAAAIRRVVVVGPAHFVPFRGIAVPSAAAFRTPLGEVPLDRAAIEAIRDLPQVHARGCAARARARPRGRAAVSPGRARRLRARAAPGRRGDRRRGREVLDRLWDGPDTLVVISSDLSHYEPYDRAQEHDAATAAAIERLDARGARAARCLRLSADRRACSWRRGRRGMRGRAPGPAQFGRHRGTEGPGGRLRRLGVLRGLREARHVRSPVRRRQRLQLQALEGAVLSGATCRMPRCSATTPRACRRSRSTTPSTGCPRRRCWRTGRPRPPTASASCSRPRAGSRTCSA